MELFIGTTVALLGLIVSFWQGYISREQLKMEKAKMSTEKEENKMQSLANKSSSIAVHQFELSRTFLSHIPSMPKDIEHQNMEYLLEDGRSKKLIIFISGLGLDHMDFEKHIQSYNEYDCLAISTYGFQPLGSNYALISIVDHVKLLIFLLNQLIDKKDYTEINMVGFSIGADLVLRIVADSELELNIQKCVFLDPNVNSQTLFISKKISSIVDQETSFGIAKEISTQSGSNNLDDWLNIHRYLIEIFDKFGSNRLPFLKDFASQIVNIYSKNDSLALFESLIENAAKNTIACNLIFSDSAEQLLFKKQLDSKIPYNVNIKVLLGTGHFDLINRLSIIQGEIKG